MNEHDLYVDFHSMSPLPMWTIEYKLYNVLANSQDLIVHSKKLIPTLGNPSIVLSSSGCRWNASDRMTGSTPYNRVPQLV